MRRVGRLGELAGRASDDDDDGSAKRTSRVGGEDSGGGVKRSRKVWEVDRRACGSRLGPASALGAADCRGKETDGGTVRFGVRIGMTTSGDSFTFSFVEIDLDGLTHVVRSHGCDLDCIRVEG